METDMCGSRNRCTITALRQTQNEAHEIRISNNYIVYLLVYIRAHNPNLYSHPYHNLFVSSENS